ncbi:MAG: HAMP domain-containing sensor histidine kinase [Chromatiales bacterium]|nr:HAMP domain-containing sensor histidine kinase [Chromatiales bacterium]
MSPDSAIHYEQNVHVREMIARVHWLVRLRWGFVALLLLAAIGAAAGLLPLRLDARWPAMVGAALFLSNLFFLRRSRRLDATDTDERLLRRHGLGEILFDYLALAVIVHALGGLATPAIFLVIPNVVIAALFFGRGHSLVITIAGMLLVAAPVLLTMAGVLPLHDPFGDGVSMSLAHTIVYLAIYAGVVLFSWYLASHITLRLVQDELKLERNYRDILRLDEARTHAIVQGAHELKAPLAAIRSYAWTLRDGYAGPLPDKAREIVARIGERCDRLLSRLTDIVRLSNLQSFVLDAGQRPNTDLIAAVRHAVSEASRNAAARDIVVETTLPDGVDALPVCIGREQLENLLDNLLGNAINYSRDGGVVRMRVAGADGGARIEIEDQGIGIPADALPHVFEEHYRARNAVSHSASGTGLGLPIVREILRLAGGDIDIESEEGKGTRAIVTLPDATENNHPRG